MSISWVDILIFISYWAAMVGAGLAAIVAIIVAILRNEQWRYAGIAFVCGFVLTFLVVLVMIFTR